MTLRSSVLLFVGVAAAGVLLLGGISWQQGRAGQALSDRLVVDVQVGRAAGMADMRHDGLRATVLGALLAGPDAGDAEKREIRAELAEFSRSLVDSMAQVEQAAHNEALRTAVQAARPRIERYVKGAQGLVDAALSDPAATQALRPAFDADFKVLEAALDQVSALVEAGAGDTVRERDQLFARARWAMGLAIACIVLALLGLGLPFARALLRRLGAEPARLRELANRIAAGELDARFDRSQMAAGSAQIMVGNDDLALRTERQAAQLQDTAASLGQMSGAVQQTAEHARSASELAAGASAVANRGGDAVRRVVSTMGEIRSSSHRIAEIINVIDGIAFQTNILALNAAVEAARAGQQGRGFAVVAGEVRSLAQRCAGAAREIKALIGNSVEKVDAGDRIVCEAGSTMDELVDRVRRVHELIGEISRAASEQTAGIVAVNRSMSTLDQATQQNTALVEESALATQSLEGQARRLAQSVAQFRLVSSPLPGSR